jgi:hypothetical protein
MPRITDRTSCCAEARRRALIEDDAAEVRQHRDGQHRLFPAKLLEETIGAKFNIVTGYQAARKSSWLPSAAKCNAGHQHPGLFWPRAVSYLAEKGACADLDSNRQEEKRAIARCADAL